LRTGTARCNVNSRSPIESDQQRRYSKSKSARTGVVNSNTKSNISMNGSRDTKGNTNSRRSSVALGQSDSEHENISRPTVQRRKSVAHKDTVRSVTVTPAAAADDNDCDDDDEVMSTSYNVRSLETAQQSERQMKNMSMSSARNSSKLPIKEKRKIMFGKKLSCFLINIEVILATSRFADRIVNSFFFRSI